MHNREGIQLGFRTQFYQDGLEEQFIFASQNGFSCLELHIDFDRKTNLAKTDKEMIKEHAERYGIEISLHTDHTLPSSSTIPEVQQVVCHLAGETVVLASSIGARRVTIHPGQRDTLTTEFGANHEALIGNLNNIVENASTYDIDICLENFARLPHLMCTSLEEMEYIVKSVDGLMVTLDIGHANTTDTSLDVFFSRLRRYIRNIHVHDNHGRNDEHLMLGSGNADLMSFFGACEHERYLGPFIIENPSRESIMSSSRTARRLLSV